MYNINTFIININFFDKFNDYKSTKMYLQWNKIKENIVIRNGLRLDFKQGIK